MKGTKDTNYVFPKKEDVEIIVGDEKQENFYPRMKIKRWDNEVNFSIGVISDHTGSDSKKDNKVEWNDGHGTKARFYELPPDEQNENGIFEFELELDKKPESNVIEMSIETKGLRFNYQPALTQKEIESGNCRDENVIGSYAIYHATKRNDTTSLGGKNYRCGKFCHIYRPKIIDINGVWTWADLNIDIENSLLTITIDQVWLDNAKYPIIVDPTFGQTDTASSYDTAVNLDEFHGLINIFPCDITTIQSMHMYCRAHLFSLDAFNIKGIIILDDGTIITNGVTDAVNVNSTSAAWYTFDFSTDPDATSYAGQLCVLGYIMEEDGNTGKGVAYDSLSEDWNVLNSVEDNSNSYATPTNPTDMNVPFSMREWSIYCTYTAAAAGGGATQLVNGGLVS